MKAKEKEWSYYLRIAVIAVVIVCLVLFAVVDGMDLMDTVSNWFYDNFMYLADYTGPDGINYLLVRPDWTRVKYLLLAALIAVCVSWVMIAFLVNRRAWRRQREKAVRELGEKIREYLASDRDASDLFREEYGAIGAQIAELKAKTVLQEQKLREEERDKSDLITYLAHDLKTPLTSVIGYLSLLDEARDLPEAQREKYTAIALGKAERLEGLVNEFFEITRYNLRRITLHRERVDLSLLLTQLAEEFYPMLAQRGNTARLDLPEELTVWADPDKLARVFNNLLKNAASYSDPDTEIVISAEVQGGQAVAAIRNQGPTIPREKLDAVFEKFYRGDEARGTGSAGAGLGLAIAREIVSLHGGAIQAMSANRVTTFAVTLPLEGEPAPQEPGSGAPPALSEEAGQTV